MIRRTTRCFKLGNVGIGSDYPISVQSMCNTRTADLPATLTQIEELAAAGCDIARVSVDTEADRAVLKELCAASPLPLVADIQFAAPLALAAIESGFAGVRLNPGIVRDEKILSRIAAAAKAQDTVIRVGANAGSLKPGQIAAFQRDGVSRSEAVASALAAAAAEQCAALERFGVSKIKVALKCSEVETTVAACEIFAAGSDYPLHLGLTEAGIPERGVLKSAVCLGRLLLAGLGDTVRVSLTAPPVEEVRAARRILAACGLEGEREVDVVSCPTCGRTEIDLIGLTREVEGIVAGIQNAGRRVKYRRIAVMGCPVNGPGEAREADLGIAGSRQGQLLIFRRGEVVGAWEFAEGLAKFRQMLME